MLTDNASHAIACNKIVTLIAYDPKLETVSTLQHELSKIAAREISCTGYALPDNTYRIEVLIFTLSNTEKSRVHALLHEHRLLFEIS
ncbi:MAG: hypothetical protein M3Q80_00495 [bacterium]|nr:hypothetical protein [bacterium]